MESRSEPVLAVPIGFWKDPSGHTYVDFALDLETAAGIFRRDDLLKAQILLLRDDRMVSRFLAALWKTGEGPGEMLMEWYNHDDWKRLRPGRRIGILRALAAHAAGPRIGPVYDLLKDAAAEDAGEGRSTRAVALRCMARIASSPEQKEETLRMIRSFLDDSISWPAGTRRSVARILGDALDRVGGEQSGLEEPGFAKRVGEAVEQIRGNVVVALDAGLFDPATAARLMDPGDTTLVGLWMELRDDVLPWPKERAADLQITVVAPENREEVLKQYTGWHVIQVGRRLGTPEGFLSDAALPRVVVEALVAGADLEIDVTSYDVGTMTLEKALEKLHHLLSA